MSGVRLLRVAALLFTFGRPDLALGESDAWAAARLELQGSHLALYRDGVRNDADQTVNVGESARIRTCYGSAGTACGAVSAERAANGLVVRGELRGPELRDPIALTTPPGGSFILPGFQTPGDYFLENIRLEDAAGRVLAPADPPVATIHVRQILLASATVTSLSLADLRARGITLTQQNFQAFNFAVGFLFEGTVVSIELPVLYQMDGAVDPLDKPQVKLDGLPDAIAHVVSRWQPPTIIPFHLDAGGQVDGQTADDEEETEKTPLFGAIVLPGSVSYLNQFFDARLVVANGAPAGSGATLRAVTGAIRLPHGSAGQDLLRLAATSPPVAPGQKVPVTADGREEIGPGQQGSASWTVEGLESGTHTLRIEIEAELDRPGRDPFALTGTALAAVEVVDPRFNLTFSHPDVVRDGEPYTLYVTVTNLSRAAQQLITVDLSGNMTNAHPADGSDTLKRPIARLEPGQAETVEYRLVPETTGRCVASTFQSTSSAGQGTIRFHVGVGELGIPLSPASLVLPRFTDRLPAPLVQANVRLLGLAYSLAVAPAGVAPAGLPHVIRTDVERRAVDLGEAGQRLFLKEPLLESLEALALDQLGNRHPLAEFDALRRSLEKGRLAADAMGAALRWEQAQRNLNAVPLLDHLTSTMSYARPWIGVTVSRTDPSRPAPIPELRRIESGAITYLARTTAESGPLRSLPFGEVYSVADGGDAAPLALVGRVDATATHALLLHAENGAGSARIVAVVPNGARTGFLRVDFGTVSFGAGDVYGVNLVPAGPEQGPRDYRLVWAATGIPVSGLPPPQVSDVALPPFRIEGAVQDGTLDPYGLGISYLFNRPPDAAALQNAGVFRVVTRFHGQDTSSPALTVDRTIEISGAAAFLQPNSERVVNVRYASPISPISATFENGPVVVHEHRPDLAAIRDRNGSGLDADVPAISVESGHTGGLVDGKVVRGTGELVAGAVVQLVRSRCIPHPLTGECNYVRDLVGQVTTGADGAFFFPYVEEPPSNHVVSGFTVHAAVPPSTGAVEEKEEVSSRIRLNGRLAHVNITLLGRGTISGDLRYADDGQPVVGGTVSAASTLFSETQKTVVAADGAFSFAGLPVGPITLSGKDLSGRRVYATVAIERPGQSVSVGLRLTRGTPARTGTVVGTVTRRTQAGVITPAVGASVGVYSSGAFIAGRVADSAGGFRFTDVPAGHVTVQAMDLSISRSAAMTDVTLAADDTASVSLVIPETGSRVVAGRVLFHDPITNQNVPVAGAPAFIEGPGSFAYTDSAGHYRIENVPVQGVTDRGYTVTAIDLVRKLQGNVTLPPVLDTGDDAPIPAADIVLTKMTGGIDGLVVDPLGRPAAGVTVDLGFNAQTTTDGNGEFHFDEVGVGGCNLVAHTERVGYFGEAATTVVFGGHRPKVTIRLVGAGVVKIHVHTRNSTGSLTPVLYKPTRYEASTRSIRVASHAVETTTDANGDLTLAMAVGSFSISATNPFHGTKGVAGTVDYPGHVQLFDIEFADASTVHGQVVDVDGITPVPGADVAMAAGILGIQRQRADAQGMFRFELVPEGGVSVSAAATIGTVERVGRSDGLVTGAGQTLELTVRMRAQGALRGRVVERVGSELRPLAGAQVYVTEGDYPTRRLPLGGGYVVANSDGRYEVAHVNAGYASVVARDSAQVARQGRGRGDITADWQVVDVPDIVLETSVGALAIHVTDPATGAPVPDCQVTLSTGEATVADADGRASYDALPLGTYSVYAFHAPTGRGGRVENVRLLEAGALVNATILLDQRGEVSGAVWDDASRTTPVGGATVQLTGSVDGRLWSTTLTALATTASSGADAGKFRFSGVPSGHFTLTAALETSPRRASATTDLTPTSPLATLDLVLEPVQDRYVKLYESVRAEPHLREIDPLSGIFSVEMRQPFGCDGSHDNPCTAQFVLSTPSADRLYRFSNVLVSRSFGFLANELSGEERSVQVPSQQMLGAGSATDPYRLVLDPKGVVRVTVRDAVGAVVRGATVTLYATRATYQLAADDGGQAAFVGVPAGAITAAARMDVRGGRTSGAVVYDDDFLDLTVSLEPAAAAHGVVYLAPAGDVWNGDPSSLQRASGAPVELTDSRGQKQVIVTSADGTYAFPVLPIGACQLRAWSADGQAFTSASAAIANGVDNELPMLVLDASAPRLVSISPPPGQEGVSRSAALELVFSEPLLTAVLPSGPAASFFRLTSGVSGLPATGTWSASLDATGRQVIRFVPAVPYDNQTVYSVGISGGPNGVRDRAGRPLTDTGDLGSSFTTSDTVGPRIVATLPRLDRPVDPKASVQFDFSEALTATDAELNGDGVDDAAELSWGRSDGAGGIAWQPLPVTMLLTRGGYSLVVQQPQGLVLFGDTLKRRIRISRLRDASGNLMAEDVREYRIFDANPPQVAVSFPSGASDGRLSPGTTYTLLPVLSNLDDVSGTSPGGDVDRVDFYLASPSDPTQAAPAPVFSARSFPFTYAFAAAYVGDGVSPRPFPVWVEAVDTSTNRSNRVSLAMQVLPNVAPRMAGITPAATAPVAGTFYAGSTIRATVAGLEDPDGAQVTLSAELRKENLANPNAAADVVATATGVLIPRPAGGWSTLVPPTVSFVIPLSLPEGTRLLVRAKAIDSVGAAATLDSTAFPVADDATLPIVDGVTAHLSGATATATRFTIGQRFVVDVRAHDAETAVKSVSVTLDGVFASPQPATLVGGTTDLYRTAVLTVPPGIPSQGVTVTATALVDDVGGNRGTSALPLRIEPTSDPTAPTGVWSSPWDGAHWPSGYTSVTSPGQGTSLLLRLRAADRDLVAGQDAPGEIVSVEMRGPVDATGALAEAWSPAWLAPGTAGPGTGTYQLAWHVPNGVAEGASLPFEARISDAGGHQTIVSAQLLAVATRRVFEGVDTAVLPDDSIQPSGGDPAGAIFLLGGSTVSVYPRTDGTVRQLPEVVLLAGADVDGSGQTIARPSVLTAPEVSSYSSSIPYYPLELGVDRFLGIGDGTRIDLSGHGLLGNDTTHTVAPPGESAAQPRAGGSHGGLGGPGSPTGGWSRDSYSSAGSVYDSLRDPALPGGGGGSGLYGGPGQKGGGVVRLIAPAAHVTLWGDVLADAGVATSGADSGGAGGAIRILARKLDGAGRVSANGSHGSSGYYGGGGGGGRIAISYVETEPAGIPWTVQAWGGFDDARGTPDVVHAFGGAGTVFLEKRDATTGSPLDSGALVVSNRTGKPAALTPLATLGAATLESVDVPGRTVVVSTTGAHGVLAGDRVVLEDTTHAATWVLPVISEATTGLPSGQRRVAVQSDDSTLQAIEAARAAGDAISARARVRLTSISGRGAARITADDDVEIGDASPALNDRAALVLDTEARAILRGESPQVVFNATPTATDVNPGTTVSVAWTATDPIGLARTEQSWTLGNAPAPVNHDWEPMQVTQGAQPLSFAIPVNAPAGPVTYTVRTTDRVGRTAVATRSWNVLADTHAPNITAIELAPVKPNDTYTAGDALTVTVRATDDVALSKIRITFNGQTTEYASSPAVLAWTAPPVPAETPYTISVEARDVANNVTTGSRTIKVVPLVNPDAPVPAITCPSSGAILPSALAGFVLSATATDDVGVQRLEFFKGDETTPFSTVTPASGTPKTFAASSAATTLPVVTAATPYRLRVRAYDASNNYADAISDVTIVPAVELSATGPNDWASLVDKVAYLKAGTLAIDTPRTLGGLLVLGTAVVTHSASAVGAEKALALTVNGPVYIDCNAAIDVTGKGYPAPKVTYPGETGSGNDTGGSHLGKGGIYAGAVGTTYGSVTQPQELGAASNHAAGGGRIRLTAQTLMLDGDIRANGGGGSYQNGGAGGSVWVTAANVTGNGAIEARAVTNNYTAGGGGAVAVEYGQSAGTWQTKLSAAGGSNGGNPSYNGAAGTVWVNKPGATFGDLTVDNKGTASAQATELPSLGHGVAQAGSNVATLVTDRTADVPAYFTGHWVEVSTSAGVLKGTYRVGTIDHKTVTLLANGGDVPSVGPGDLWQGVYRFDNVKVVNGAPFVSADPIRTWVVYDGGTAGLALGTLNSPANVELRGNVTATSITASAITIRSGATVVPTSGQSLTLATSGALTIESGAIVDVSSKGYAPNSTYPGAGFPGSGSGGSHLGVGGAGAGALAGTFGSVTRPQEFGGAPSSGGTGGGALRISAGSVALEGQVLANGGGGAAGGSVWITATTSVTGDGSIQALGGDSANAGGGGGAVMVEYAQTGGSWFTHTTAHGGRFTGTPTTSKNGGAGTVVTRSAPTLLGDLLLDNGGVVGQSTVLPALGSGTAQSGSSGVVLVSDRTSDVPAYFVGHWVEISRAGTLLGTYRIESIDATNKKKVTLAANGASDVPTVLQGDQWRGVYRFDTTTFRNGAASSSADPIRSDAIYDGGTSGLPLGTISTTGRVELRGAVNAISVSAGDIVLRAGSTLTPLGSGVVLSATGSITIQNGATVDASGKGWGPGYSFAGPSSGGSHIGYGGLVNPPLGTTAGAVTQPQETGAGGPSSGGAGGGTVRIDAPAVLVDGNVRASGGTGAAGGSVWLSTTALAGDGVIEARGGDSPAYGGGGGGAIAIAYGSASGTLLSNVTAYGGRAAGSTNDPKIGGAGTIWKSTGTGNGALVVDNGGATGQATGLPAVGAGSVGTVYGPSVFQPSPAPTYFYDEWIALSTAAGQLKGIYRGNYNPQTGRFTLYPNGSDVPSPVTGDRWQGVWRFDDITVAGGATLTSADPIIRGTDAAPYVDVTYSGPTPPRPGDSFSVLYDAHDDVRLASVKLEISGAMTATETKSVTGTSAQGSFSTRTIPSNAAGSLSILVTTTDLFGQTGTSQLSIPLAGADVPPTVQASYSGPVPPRAGDAISFAYTAHDDIGLTRVRIDVTGAFTHSEERPASGLDASGTFGPLSVPASASGAVHAVVTAFDGRGQSSTSIVDVTIGAPDGVPSITGTCSCGSGLRPGQAFSISYHAADDVALAGVTLDLTGSVTAHQEQAIAGNSSWDGTFDPVTVPSDATTPVHVVLTVRDSRSQTSTFSFDLPVVGLAVSASVPSSVEAGAGMTVHVHASSPDGLKAMKVAVDGAFTYERSLTLASAGRTAPLEVTRDVVVPVPSAAWSGTASVTVSVTDGASATIVSAPVEAGLTDSLPPLVAVVSPLEGDVVVAGQPLEVFAEVHDAGVFESLKITVGSDVQTLAGRSGETLGVASLVPDTTAAGTIAVQLEARDAAGNVRTEARTVTVLAAGSPNPRFSLGGPGTLTTAGVSLPLTVEAGPGAEITRVEFTREGEAAPFADVSGSGAFAAVYPVPADTPDGTTIRFVARAHTLDGKHTDARTSATVVNGDVLTGDHQIAADDLSHEDHAVVVSEGNVTVAGTHRFARLAVLTGRITHERGQSIDLTVANDVFVGRDGLIDASYGGFRGGMQGFGSTTGETYPSLTGSAPGVGGSHAGLGGAVPGSSAGTCYGSVTNPDTPGAGGGAAVGTLDPGGSGGGVIRFSAASLRVDGLVLANGEPSNSAGSGAGGSIRVDSPVVDGTGMLVAGGGLPDSPALAGRSGGGGRVAIRGRAGPRVAVLAWAGSQVWATGGAGTQFFLHAEDAKGHLLVDGSPAESGGETRLVSIGSGTVTDAGTTEFGSDFSDSSAAWVHGVEGLEVEITRGTAFVGRFRVVGPVGPTTLMLDPSAEGQIQAGDHYQGVQAFDTVRIVGRAHVVTTDVLEGAVSVEDGSTLAGPPTRGSFKHTRPSKRSTSSRSTPPRLPRPHHGVQP